MSPFDAVVVGSGAGGSAAAYQLASKGFRVVVLEKGTALPSDCVYDPAEFVSREVWASGTGEALQPDERFNLGGKTKWYGAALVRFSREEFSEDRDFGARAWPFSHEELTPYYEQAERMLGVNNFPCEDHLRGILEKLSRADPSWDSRPLPLALSKEILQRRHELTHFDGFAIGSGLKGDAETAFISRFRNLTNVQLLTNSEVSDLLPATGNPRIVVGVKLGNGATILARAVLLAAGALQSPRLMCRYVAKEIPELPAAKNVGSFLKLHICTALLAFSFSRNTDLLRKTMFTLNCKFPHSSLQPLGIHDSLLCKLIPESVPHFVAQVAARRAYPFFVQTEDGSVAANRVYEKRNSLGAYTPVLDYDERRVPKSEAEHRQFVRAFRYALIKAGIPTVARRVRLTATAHACGSLAMGSDPQEAVVDSRGRVFGLKGLYVVDGSVLPRSSRVNPALTIYAWGLRAADLLSRELASPAL